MASHPIAVKTCLLRCAACLLSDADARNVDSPLKQPMSPLLSQQLLIHRAAKQKAESLILGWDEQEGIVLGFNNTHVG